VYVLRGEGFRAGLVLFGNAIDKNLSSVSVTQDGDVMGFSVRGGDTVKMAVNGIVFDALYMEADSKADYESKDYTNPYKQYIYFQCTGIEPIQIDKSSAIRFAADEAETKQFIMVIEENGYGLSAFTVTSSPEKPFLIEHPSLAAETMVSQVRFDTLFNKITAYKIGPDDEETVLPYEESEITTAGKSEQRLFAELLREALWRAQNNVSD
jgi:hypothetical protein